MTIADNTAQAVRSAKR